MRRWWRALLPRDDGVLRRLERIERLLVERHGLNSVDRRHIRDAAELLDRVAFSASEAQRGHFATLSPEACAQLAAALRGVLTRNPGS